MDARQDWVSYQCSCGFRLDRVPRNVVADLPRCLGCGRALGASPRLATRSVSDVRGLK